jgi:hypothetical protein
MRDENKMDTGVTSRTGCKIGRAIRGDRQRLQTRDRCLNNEVGDYCVAPVRSDRRRAGYNKREG